MPSSTHSAAQRCLLASAASCLLCASVSAQWSPVWPAYEHPRDTRQQVMDCYSALVERAACVGRSAPDSPAFYRTFGADVDALKECLRDITPFYTPTNSDGYYTAISSFPLLTMTGLCSQVRVPTNMPWYTSPRRELAGLGGHTEDAGVIGHGHGFTNTTTAAGGPHLPAGRSTWYTTDYGLDALRSAIDALAWTAQSAPIYETVLGTAKQGVGLNPSWAAAKSASESSWADAPGYIAVIFGSWGQIGYSDYGARLYGGAGSVRVAHSYYATPRQDQFYAIASLIDADGANDEFYPYNLGQGFPNLSQGYLNPIAESSIQSGSANTSATWTVDLATILAPGWCVEPDWIDGTPSSKGAMLNDWGVLTKWRFTVQNYPEQRAINLQDGGAFAAAIHAGQFAPRPVAAQPLQLLRESGGTDSFQTLATGRLSPAGDASTVYVMQNTAGGLTRLIVQNGAMMIQ